MSRRLSRFVLLGSLVAGSLTAGAQRLFADFTGAWDVVVQGPQGAMASVLTISQKGDSVGGRFESEVGTAELAGNAKGDSLRFTFSIDAGGQMLNLLALAALKDKDHLEGKIVAEGMGEFPFTAARK